MRTILREWMEWSERIALRLIRLPLIVSAATAVLLLLDVLGVPVAFAAARIGVRFVLAAYLLAGVVNAPSFPRVLRGPRTGTIVDRALLDAWTVIALIVGTMATVNGTVAGLL